MVLGYHVIISAYGFWLPNDPRGSWSDFVRHWELRRFGAATKVSTRRSVAGAVHDARLRRAAKDALRYPEVHFTGAQAREIGAAFGEYAAQSGLTIWACAVLPEHVHVVLARYRFKVEQVINFMKGAATSRLMSAGLHPQSGIRTAGGRLPHIWSRGEWKVYLNDAAAIRRAIRYVNENPVKEGKLRQRWSFVTAFESASPYDGSPHDGSPLAPR